MVNDAVLASYLASVPRLSLGSFPTPLQPMTRLSASLDGPPVYVKRDDLSGFGGGGNKGRALEYILPEAIARGADTLVTAGVVQSNSARQVAAAAARIGMACHVLMVTDRVDRTDSDYAETGNVFLGRLFGASFESISVRDNREEKLRATADRLRREGRSPYVVPYGCSNQLGATGYLRAALEIAHQIEERRIGLTHLVHASGTGGTQAGLVAGFAAMDLDIEVVGIDVDADPIGVDRRVGARLTELTEALGLPPMLDRIKIDSRYSAGAYGVADDTVVEAIQLGARLEALLLDPVYSGKGFAGLVGLVRSGYFPPDAEVLFLHTGGDPALFAHRSLFAE
jgi:L-cysteate sulfo-lyase